MSNLERLHTLRLKVGLTEKERQEMRALYKLQAGVILAQLARTKLTQAEWRHYEAVTEF